MDKIDAITLKMIAFDAGSAERIQHFIKVHRFAQLIGRGEHLDHTPNLFWNAPPLSTTSHRAQHRKIRLLQRRTAGKRGAGLCAAAALRL